MEYNYYLYHKQECNLKILQMPIWFKEVNYEGDPKNGMVILHSQDEYDEYWGSNAKMQINWEEKDRSTFYYAKEVQKSIGIYNAIGVVVSLKEATWHLSHEFTFWYGERTKILHKRFYKEKCLHGIFYCDISNRLFNIHTDVIDNYFENFKQYLLKSYKTITCHEV
jgi:hypothetical protein